MKLKRVNLLGGTWKVKPIRDGFEIVLAEMYESPKAIGNGVSLAVLDAIAKHFSTTNIDVGNVSLGGCETCDWGSLYGVEIQVRNPTSNTDTEETTIEVQ